MVYDTKEKLYEQLVQYDLKRMLETYAYVKIVKKTIQQNINEAIIPLDVAKPLQQHLQNITEIIEEIIYQNNKLPSHKPQGE